MIIRHVKPEEAEKWLSMRTALWPETDEEQHRKEMAMMLSDAGRYAVFVCEDPQGLLIGFVEVSLREWAEGCLSSPVGYLEGWFVASHARGIGIGKKLLAASENWARLRGCTEMASDTDLGNTASEAAHLKLGFQVAARVIAFRKDLRTTS
jgi:aminoglycoside 6'-N-acetyltransferase I